MCGICGILSPSIPDPEVHLSKMVEALQHRGPDDEGSYISSGIALGFKRLSIIDLESGHQPIRVADGRFTIVFNGEIYNFPELRKQLESEHDIVFSTRSDTEVVLQAIATWGVDAFAKFNGMFALAVWDSEQKELLLARDRAGKKPLYYTIHDDALYFASEIKAINSALSTAPGVDSGKLATSLAYRYVPIHETLFSKIDALPASSYARIALTRKLHVDPQTYWRPELRTRLTPPITIKKAAALQGQLKKLLAEAVDRRLISDVPVGAFLSGGLDSSVIVALMAQLCSSTVKTFSIGFDTGYSETQYSRSVARHFNTEHHETIVSAHNLLREIPSVLWHRETPISEPSDIPLFILSRQASDHVKVVLSGEGSDELFAGYPKHVAAYYMKSFPGKAFTPLLPVLNAFYRRSGSSSRLALALSSLSQAEPAEAMSEWFGAFNLADRRKLLSPELASYDVHYAFKKLTNEFPRLTPLGQMQLQDFAHWLPANLLLRSDRVTMAHGLELRCPFLDPNLINFAFNTVSDEYKVRRGTSKWILRQMAKDILPREIVQRKKWGFKVPVGEWFRGPLKKSLQETLFSERSLRRGYYNDQEVRRIVDQHVSGSADYTKQLWYLYQLELWHLMFIDQELASTDSL